MAAAKRKPKESTGDTAMAKLNKLGIDWYCEQIVSGMMLGAVASKAGVSRRSVVRWLSADKNRLSQANAARILSAEAFDEQAEEILSKARNTFQLTKAREIASHKRWRASKIAPKIYGDRQELVGAGGDPLIPPEPRDHMEIARRIAFGLRRVTDAMGKGVTSTAASS